MMFDHQMHWGSFWLGVGAAYALSLAACLLLMWRSRRGAEE